MKWKDLFWLFRFRLVLYVFGEYFYTEICFIHGYRDFINIYIKVIKMYIMQSIDRNQNKQNLLIRIKRHIIL